MKFLKEGVLPYTTAPAIPGDTAKDTTWSTEIETGQRDSEDDDRRTEHGGNQQEDEYALLHSTETDEGRHPGRPLSWGDNRDAYAKPMPSYADYREGEGVNALSPGGYDEFRREAGAGAGLENKQTGYGGSGYSFR
jgi:hypothetical protein